MQNPTDSKVLNFPRQEAPVPNDSDVNDILARLGLGGLKQSDETTGTGMSTPTREEFEARIETVEARMETRVERIEGRINAFLAHAEEREKRLEERDRRIESIAASAAKSAEQAVSLKTNMWLAALTVIIFVVGTVVAAYFATQSSNIGITQTTIAAFQQGQQTPPSKK